MMKTAYCKLILLFLLATLFGQSQAQHYVWGKSFSSQGNGSIGNAVTIGNNEDVYVAGHYIGNLNVEGTILPSGTNNQDGFIIKLDSSGVVQWVKRLGSSSAGTIEFITTASDGNLIIGGGFEGKIPFENDSIASATGGSSFIAKYNTSGDPIWYRFFPSMSISDLILDGDDNIYTAMISSEPLGFAIFNILKYDYQGNEIFNSLIYRGNGLGGFSMGRLALDASGAIFASGLASGDATIGNIKFSPGGPDGTLVIVKFNKNGTPIRITNTLDIPMGGGYLRGGITVDAMANVYYSALGDRLFLAKYDSAGNVIWKVDKQQTPLGPHKLTLDESGNIITAGILAGNFTLDNVNFIHQGFYSTFAAQFDNSGKLVWALQGQNEYLDYVADFARSRKTGDLYLTGILQSQNPSFGKVDLPAPDLMGRVMVLKISNKPGFKPLEINLGADTTICMGKSITVTLPDNFASYQWQDGSTVTTRIITLPGKYFVTAMDYSGNSYSDTLNVHASPMTTVNLGSDTILCEGDILTLNAGGGFTSYQWQDNSSNSSFKVTSQGKYTVIVKNQFGCSAQASININYLSAPKVDLGEDKIVCSSFTPLEASNKMSTYVWSTGATDSVYTPTKAGKYWVTVQNQCGQVTDSVNLFSLSDVFYPNVITLNNDGKNEKFKITGTGDELTGTFNIYNRWGEKIFTEIQYKNDWPTNDDISAGVYYFILSYPECNQNYKGWIQVFK